MPDTVLPEPRLVPESGGLIKIAVLAVGGQGGGVLADWIVDAAERSGFVAQSTSVAGVAQRTGATIYYIELSPDRGKQPVFALSPAQGDVDIVIAAELMEAGRAAMRGFVTPDRTTLIASSHRIPAVSEKIVPGDGRAPAAAVEKAAGAAARRVVAFDMEAIAVAAGSVISASLFGALAGSGALPFARDSYEAAIRASERGVAASLAAFAEAFRRADEGGEAAPPGGRSAERARPAASGVGGPPRLLAAWRALQARADGLPAGVREMARRGLAKVVDYQDPAYGGEYLDRLAQALALDDDAHGHRLSVAAAKHLANAMCYDDILRVADLKTRAARTARVRRAVAADARSVVQVTEYFHPRIEEFCGTLPAGLGRAIEARPRLARTLDRLINRGRRVRTDSLGGFAVLWLIAGLSRYRRRLLRHQVESRHLQAWFALARVHAPEHYDLAVEILNCRRLIKGYSDTHARGQSKFDRVLSAVPQLAGRSDGADWLRRLREAALMDEKGELLDGALQTVASLSKPLA
jgi:indolepyruvate ferredoxin oxidoreductase beta subunit